MSTKENLSDQLNQILGVNVEWSKMSREDLDTIAKLFRDPIGIVQLGVKMMKEKTREDIMGRKLGEILSSGSIFNLRERPRGGGPLGLGILPAIFTSTPNKLSPKENHMKETEAKPSEEDAKELEPEPAAEKHEDEKKPQP